MNPSRMEAFSDGVFAIIITIMVLGLQTPHTYTMAALRPLIPIFTTYLLSFVMLGIYWNNHHHLLRSTTKVNGTILWANLHLLFWLSLFPFCTSWLGNSHFAKAPTSVYAAILFLSGLAYYLLQILIVNYHGEESWLSEAIGANIKGQISLVIYLISFVVSFFAAKVSVIMFGLVALMWVVPDRKLESYAPKE